MIARDPIQVHLHQLLGLSNLKTPGEKGVKLFAGFFHILYSAAMLNFTYRLQFSIQLVLGIRLLYCIEGDFRCLYMKRNMYNFLSS